MEYGDVSKLPVIDLSGETWYDIGYMYGSKTSERISACFDTYLQRMVGMFLLKFKKFEEIESLLSDAKINVTDIDDKLTKKAFNFIKKSCFECMETLLSPKNRDIFGDTIDEMQGIADGSGIELWKIYYINCRGEIFGYFYQKYSNDRIVAVEEEEEGNECTTIMSKNYGVIAQNWDWIKKMEKQILVLNINQTGENKNILTMAEPGMVAKIGFNSHGVGVTINSIVMANSLDGWRDMFKGIGIHIVIANILYNYKSLSEIFDSKYLSKFIVNRFIGIGIVDRYNNGCYIEFQTRNRRNILQLNDNNQLTFHTNHILNAGIEKSRHDTSSVHRYLTLFELEKTSLHKNSKNETIKSMCKFLTDESDKEFPIWRRWTDAKRKGRVGTVTSIVMDLHLCQMHITREWQDSQSTYRECARAQDERLSFDVIELISSGNKNKEKESVYDNNNVFANNNNKYEYGTWIRCKLSELSGFNLNELGKLTSSSLSFKNTGGNNNSSNISYKHIIVAISFVCFALSILVCFDGIVETFSIYTQSKSLN